jgi:hypothetical protein
VTKKKQILMRKRKAKEPVEVAMEERAKKVDEKGKRAKKGRNRMRWIQE